MATKIRYLGVAAFEITNSDGVVVLVDPYIDENVASPIKTSDLKRVDLILVTHGASDHLGDTVKISKRFDAPIICGADVKAHLAREGVRADKILATIWGLALDVAGMRVRSVESKHHSSITEPDGTYYSGQPMGFIICPDPGVRIYDGGDTALFSDLKLIGQLYRPNIGLIHVTNPTRHLARHKMPNFLTGEMSPYEAALAAQWLGLEYAIAMHFDTTTDEPDVRAFVDLLSKMTLDDKSRIKPVVLKFGEIFQYEGKE
jgi:L-ascorbate metabolism protein UlaG (beta-lactamase superfamily)